MSLANKEWQNLAEIYAVKVCELRFAMAMIDADFKGTMTDYEVALAASTDPQYVQFLRQAIFEENIGCEDEKAPDPLKGGFAQAAKLLAGDWQTMAVSKSAIGKGIVGAYEKDPDTGQMVYNPKAKTPKSAAWKNAEFMTAKIASKNTQKQIIDQAGMGPVQGSGTLIPRSSEGWMMTAAVVAVPALLLYLLIRKPG